MATGGDKIIIGVTIGIATEATNSTMVGGGEDDTGVAVPVKGDSDTKVGGDKAVDAAVKHRKVGVGEGKRHKGAVNLWGGKGKETKGGDRKEEV